DDAKLLYAEAARRLLARLDEADATAASVGRVLLHLDNDVETAQTLLADMLERRDQWLRHVVDPTSRRISRQSLEAALARAITEALSELRQLWPAQLVPDCLAAARFAASNLVRTAPESAIAALVDIDSLPADDVGDLPRWRAIADLLLTREGNPRKRVDVAIGFSASDDNDNASQATLKAQKARFQTLAESLGRHPTLVDALHRVRLLPERTYTDTQWKLVESVTDLLPLAVAELEVLFRETGRTDFTALSQAAVRALGSEDEPTDLALALDYRIRHLLVDEFQDTSVSQFELLERLTAGWQLGDGRTLFAVGDPMQSIYRFREADVGLYLQAWHSGVGPVHLEPLALKANFRSQRGIVEWVNETFRTVMPEAEDLVSGAVPFTDSEAAHPALPGVAVRVHPLLRSDRLAEANIVVHLIREAQLENPKQRVAILVRNRSHLSAIVPALKRADLRFQAIDIDNLEDRTVVQDLSALTRALLHLGDRVAWLSVLRAPWCGLTLADLTELVGDDRRAAVWDRMQDSTALERLSVEGANRVKKLHAQLRQSLDQRRRVPLRRWIEGAWLALGGPAAADTPTELDDVEAFFDVLEELEQGGDLEELEALPARVSTAFALPDPEAGDILQVMTIHKAKGLEFDVVILPGLGLTPRKSDPRLLLWAERWRGHGQADLLLAPIHDPANGKDAVYDYLAELDKEKASHEEGRLLYVAATRARSRVHLLGHVEPKDVVLKPHSTSLLARLWPALQPHFQAALDRMTDVDAQTSPTPARLPPSMLRRFPIHWTRPPIPAGVDAFFAVPGEPRTPQPLEFSWATESARHVGTLVHRALQLIGEEGLGAWNAGRVASARDSFARELRMLGVPQAQIHGALERVITAVNVALTDPRPRWILARHAGAHSELRLTGMIDGTLVDIAIDRTFVDEHGVRWIIDFKTGVHEGADVEQFLESEQSRYREQLENYASLLSRMESRPVRLALYFPLLKGWREWGYVPVEAASSAIRP
ncbi:MAG: DNA helicase UvrD, partial [Proteobacteria bacterium]